MMLFLSLLLACSEPPAAPPSGAAQLTSFLAELCDAGAVAATPLPGTLPVRDVRSNPAVVYPRLVVTEQEVTWNSVPVSAADLPERLSRNELPAEVVIQADPSLPIERIGVFVTALRQAGVPSLSAAVRSRSVPSIPQPPEPELVRQLDRIPQPHLRIAELQRQVDTAVGDCGHAQLAFTIASTSNGSRCEVWQRQLAPALNLCPDLSADRLATLTWIMEHPTPDSFWATVPVPSPLPTKGTWDDALPH